MSGNAPYNDETFTQNSVKDERSDIFIFDSQIFDAISSKNFDTFNFSNSGRSEAGVTVVPMLFNFFINEVTFFNVESRLRSAASSNRTAVLRN